MSGQPQNDKSSDAYLGRRLDWVKRRLARTDPDYRFKWDVYFDRLEELARGAESFLDAGCGDNKTAIELEGPSVRVGIDADRTHLTGLAVCGTLEQLPFADGAFALIGCRYVAEHLDDPQRAWAELHRVMRPGGRLLIQTVNKRSLLIKASRMIGGATRRLISRRRYARRDDDVYPVRDRFNLPELFESPPPGFRCVNLTMTQDIDVQSRTGFFLTYRLHWANRHHPERRSAITAEWERI